MDSETCTLKAFFLPWQTPSHTIPLVNLAMLFAARGVHVSIITTHYNSLLFQKSIDKATSIGHHINLHIFKLPFQEVGLPEGIENFSSATSLEIAKKLFTALMMLQQPMEQLIREQKPDCLVADMHHYWASDIALDLGISRLVFHIRAYFSLCAEDSIFRYVPHEKVQSDKELFVVPRLPDKIQMTSLELPEWVRVPDGYTAILNKIAESETKSYGVVVDSFYELEKDYADYYKNVLGRKVWSVGPVWLCNKNNNESEHGYLSWLNTQKPKSVLYVCFGSLSCFSSAQLLEIATALDSLTHPFIWAIRREDKFEEAKWLLEGFEDRLKESNKGMIIRGWAPQVLILEHPAIGGFVTHCGWNSVLESISAGVPMVTWPISAEQFYNEKLVTQVLRIGVEVGAESWTTLFDESTTFVNMEKIAKAVRKLMGGSEEAEEIRKKARDLGEAAKRAVQDGGSSYNNLTALLDELEVVKKARTRVLI